ARRVPRHALRGRLPRGRRRARPPLPGRAPAAPARSLLEDARRVTRPPAVAVMAKVPGATPVKSRLHAALGAARATELYRSFLLDRLDALRTVNGVHAVVAFTPASARPEMTAVVGDGVPLLAQEGEDLTERLTHVFERLFDDGHAGVIATDSDSPTLPMRYV